MRRLVATCLLVAASPASSNAGIHDFTGNTLYNTCRANDGPSMISCFRYIGGVVDGVSLSHPDGKEPFVIPDDASITQVRDVVVNYLRDNPDKRHWAAVVLVWNALQGAFPNPALAKSRKP